MNMKEQMETVHQIIHKSELFFVMKAKIAIHQIIAKVAAAKSVQNDTLKSKREVLKQFQAMTTIESSPLKEVH